MSLSDVESIRRLISAAVAVQQRREIEQDQRGPFPVNILSRPKFQELENFAIENTTVLVSVFPTIDSVRERLAVCQALSRVTHEAIVPFWADLIGHEADEEFLSCAAIAVARLRQSDLLVELEAKANGTRSLRLLFHLGVARLFLEDPRGVDHLVEMLCQEAADDPSALSALPMNGPTKRFDALSLLKRIFPKGPGEDIPEWITWWEQRRHQYQSIDCSALYPQELAYAPPLSAFLEGLTTKPGDAVGS